MTLNFRLQRDIEALTFWSNKWLLRFNVDKCKVMHLGQDTRPTLPHIACMENF